MNIDQASPDVLPPSPPPPQAGPTADEKQWAMLAHLSALVGGLLTGWAGGWGVFVGPLAVWLLKKDTMPFVDDQGKEALNFNITVALVCVGLLLFSVITIGIGLIVAIPAWLVLCIAWLVATVVGALKASEGMAYRYPLTLRLVK
ncbi:DUF4870 domain-containing protein [Tahibacter soli]|jgi:hypothetical protein|uniref:DUF4870 domain-containing protein n=1 Tax=Tahibacter soli TaxID=2983605 RepID=A0A9X3YK02_9GAMM|nr:DUF4870 domain-containing protein [Tahibacter soli]MDC8012188.1 DUF4870 domain-containing protein [Tahibacter soli]